MIVAMGHVRARLRAANENAAAIKPARPGVSPAVQAVWIVALLGMWISAVVLPEVCR